ncbi:hypothetical protein MOQ72_36395 [Saccharopolyspora sp. K220]|nr:hypothetical protein [Saccharopolyspora soli]MCI2422919.1 hypothetical protein [Saccharopolyspora soli]
MFVADMTGNVVFLGFALQQGTGLSPAVSAVAIVGSSPARCSHVCHLK